MVFLISTPGRIRTYGRRIRNPMLYPAELRERVRDPSLYALRPGVKGSDFVAVGASNAEEAAGERAAA